MQSIKKDLFKCHKLGSTLDSFRLPFLYIISCPDIQSEVFPSASKERFSKLKSPIRKNVPLPFSIALSKPVPSRAPSTMEAFITESISVGKGTHLLYEKLKTTDWKQAQLECCSIPALCLFYDWGSIQPLWGKDRVKMGWKVGQKVRKVVSDQLLWEESTVTSVHSNFQ